MKSRYASTLLYTLLPTLLLFVGCGEDDTVDPQDERARTMILFAADDLTGADLLVDGETLASAGIFGDVIPYDSVRASNVRVVVRNAGTGTNLYEKSLNFVPDQDYTMFVVNDADGVVDIIRFRDDLTAPPGGRAMIRFAHLVYDGPTVRVGLQGSGQKLTEGVSYGEITEFFSPYDPGTFTVRVIDTVETGAGNGSGGAAAVVESELTFEAGGIYTVAAVGGTAQAELRVIRHN